LLSAAGSAAVLFNGIKESWRLARKILSQFKLLWFLNVYGNTLLAILHLEIAKKNIFVAGSAEQPDDFLLAYIGEFWATSRSRMMHRRLQFDLHLYNKSISRAILNIISSSNRFDLPMPILFVRYLNNGPSVSVSSLHSFRPERRI